MCENCNNTEFPTSTVTGPIGPTGATGATGATGSQGADGEQGFFGGNSLEFKWSTAYTQADPGPGYVTGSSSDPSLSNQLYVSWFDVNNVNVAAWISATYAVTANIGTLAMLRIFHKTDSTKYVIFSIGTGGFTSPAFENLTAIPFISSSGFAAWPFAANDPVVITYSLTGEKGDTGLTGPPGPQSIPVFNTVYVTKDGDDTTGLVNRQDRPFATMGTYGGVTGAIPAIMAYTTPTSGNPFLIKMGPGTYSHTYTISVPDWVDIDMGSARLNSSLSTSTGTLQFRGRSNIFGGGASIGNSNVAGTHVAISTNGFAGGRININSVRGTVDLNLGGATMYVNIDVITPDQGAHVNGFTNFTMRNGTFDFRTKDCYSGVAIGAASSSATVRIFDSVLKNGMSLVQSLSGVTDVKCFSSYISRPNNTANVDDTGALQSPVQNAVIYMTGTSIWEGYNNRIESLEEDFSGIEAAASTVVIKNKSTTIVAGSGVTFSIENSSGVAMNVYDYGGNSYNVVEGGSGAITDLVDIPNIDVNVI